jgi:hypothetical protein
VTAEQSPAERHRLEFAVSEQSQLIPLRDWLSAQPDVEVAVTPGTPGPGEQGALDVLTVVAGSSGLVAAIKVLPEFIRSRRSTVRIETTVRDEKFILDATNVEDVLPIIDRLLRD